MIKIAMTLDDVLRNKTSQIGKIYKKYINTDIDLSKIDLSTNDYLKIFNFKSNSDFNKFLYEDYPFEIFAEAGTVTPSLDKKLNLWHIALNDNEDIDDELSFVLTNTKEFNASIPYTYFYLSKIATRVRDIFLPLHSDEIWEKCDILITADPFLLKNTPSNKVCVKIETEYNKTISSSNIVTYASLEKFIENEDALLTVYKLYKEINK